MKPSPATRLLIHVGIAAGCINFGLDLRVSIDIAEQRFRSDILRPVP